MVVMITMFRTVNYGSILQTYSLQKKIEALGYRCQVVNYARQMGKYLHRFTMRGFFQAIINYVVYWRRDREYARFVRERLNLTREYWTPEELAANPPAADVYVTGSDQTFNSAIDSWDTSYMLDFVPRENRVKVRKIAYAASSATCVVDKKWKDAIPVLLRDYDALSTREECGLKMIEAITGRMDAQWCCDPTMLFDCQEWKKFARKPRFLRDKPYILVYLLSYAVNPYPEADRLVREAQDVMGCRVVYLQGRKQDFFKPNSRLVKNVSPYEFVYLFLHAEMIFTSSFHGAAFSVQSGRPFLAFVSGDETADSRVLSLLRKVGAERNAVEVPVADAVHFESLTRWRPANDVGRLLTEFREMSFAWLKESLT